MLNFGASKPRVRGGPGPPGPPPDPHLVKANNCLKGWQCALQVRFNNRHFVAAFLISVLVNVYQLVLLPPANEVCEGYVLQVCVCPQGGVRGCGGRAWLWGGHACLRGVCGCRGHAWLRGACLVARRGVCVGYDEIRSMIGQYASYWIAFLLSIISVYRKATYSWRLV